MTEKNDDIADILDVTVANTNLTNTNLYASENIKLVLLIWFDFFFEHWV